MAKAKTKPTSTQQPSVYKATTRFKADINDRVIECEINDELVLTEFEAKVLGEYVKASTVWQ